MNPVILASQSPRRKQLLEWAEIPFEIIVRPTEETFPDGLDHKEAAIFIAKEKCMAVKRELKSGRTILAADTIVVLDNRIIGKPAGRAEAIETLKDLSGKVHHVITGVYISRPGNDIYFAEVTEVEFHPLTDAQVAFYVDKYQPYDKAGAYAIQEWIGVTGIKRINGDFYNVMGLPVSRVVANLV